MFDNINEATLKSYITNCQQFLNLSKDLSKFINISDDVWSGSPKTNFVNSVTKLKQNIKKLDKKLDDYIDIINLITKYKNLEKTQKSLSTTISGLNQYAQMSDNKEAKKDLKEKKETYKTNQENLNSILEQIKQKIN